MVPQKAAGLLLSVFFFLQFLATLKRFGGVFTTQSLPTLTVTCILREPALVQRL